ncbi:glycosylated lysosomal membrane protein-like [Ostrea edulis]|uniref:glycosylated lysosomal membrane protein-like n=1 Tax=Ostrea edulis TaxID=37623 RepID=UPI0024AF462A|nr:glycosylated lysosomal membrane protein-like [Ostrea edulis]
MITCHVTAYHLLITERLYCQIGTTVKMLIKSFLVIFSFSFVFCDGPFRSMTTFFNPGCESQKCPQCNPGLAYVMSKGSNDILHYIISAIGGPPTALVIRTNKPYKGKSQLQIDCKKVASKNETERREAITMPAGLKEIYSFGVVFSRLFQYNDTADKADITKYGINGTTWRVYDFTDVEWQDITKWSSNNLIVMKVENSGEVLDRAFYNDSLILQFHLFDQTDRSKELPHLQYDSNSMHIDFTLQDIDTGNSSSARWGLETVLLGSDSNTAPMSINTKKSIDDEYAPGVFSISNWLTRPGNEANGGYLQWRPVCYLKSARARSVATKVDATSLASTTYVDDFLNSSVLYSYFPDIEMISRYATNFTFGLEKDGGFTKTNYTSWTAQLGYGAPPEDKVSSLVIGVISAGLGLPVVIIMFGGLFVVIKKKTTAKEGYTDLDKDNSQIQ